MQKTMIIAGAGISGFATGYYAQLNGYKSTIFESQNTPGGLCAAWTRKGYTFDISMHIVPGSRRGALKQLWDELGVTRDREFFYHDSIAVVEGNGKRLELCLDRSRLEEQMLAISPGDSALIREFVGLLFGRGLTGLLSLEPPELAGTGGKFKMALSLMPLLASLIKYSGVSLQEFAARFKDPFLARAVRFSVDSPGWPMPRYPMVALQGFAQAGVGEAGYPLGGSKKVVLGIAERYKKLGGEIRYKSRGSFERSIFTPNMTCVIG